MSGDIEYKQLLKVSPTEEEDTYSVNVELSAAPEGAWVLEFEERMKNNPFCPTVALNGKIVTFCCTDSTLQRSLQRLRTAIFRTNRMVNKTRPAMSAKGKAALQDVRDAKAAKKAAKREKELREDGF